MMQIELINKISYYLKRGKWATQASGFWLDMSYAWLNDNIKPNTTLLDIGSSIGDTSVYFATNPNVTKVLAYECNKKRYDDSMKVVSTSAIGQKIKFYNIVMDRDSLIDALKTLSSNVAIKCDIDGGEIGLFDNVNMEKVYIAMLE